MIRKVVRVCFAAGAALILPASSASALDCSEKLVTSAEQSISAYAELAKIISGLRKKDPRVLANATGEIIVIQRYVSGEASARGGDSVAELPLKRIGRGLSITYGKRKIEDFTIDPVFADMDLSTIVHVKRGVCGESLSCGSIPTGSAFDQLLADLIECNGGKKGVFELDDAFVVLDMGLTKNVAIGEGVIIQKWRGKLQPKALVISQ